MLLHNAARYLLSQGNEVIFLLSLSTSHFKQFNEEHRLALPNPDHCRAYHVQAITEGKILPRGDFQSDFEYESYRFSEAASEVYRLEKPDIFEFFEYSGAAYHSLCKKVSGVDFHDSHIAVRLHNSLELIDSQQPDNIHSIDRYIMYNLEHQALRLAETVLYPSRVYLEKQYRPNYEPWFGKTSLSTPPLLEHPNFSTKSLAPTYVLFYGRLFGIKGIDIFVDAALLYLNNPDNPKREFYVVGYDSKMPPGKKGNYQDYLRQKIPPKYQDCFYFTGQMSWQDLASLLPNVLFAIIPSYQESFCYAAHELYAAGIPLIVSDIPAFEDTFTHEKNALLFDGSAGDLANQMERLSKDADLREKITFPYPVLQQPLGEFYSSHHHNSWIKEHLSDYQLSVLVCILCDHPDRLDQTIQSLQGLPAGAQIITAHPAEATSNEVSIWFLGRSYSFRDTGGIEIYPTQIKTSESLLILQAGDILDPQYVPMALSILRDQAQVGYVGCWKRIPKLFGEKIVTQSFDASPELIPLKAISPFGRFVLRTPPGKYLMDLLDSRAGRFGEIAYLWTLDTDESCGITIPQPLISSKRENHEKLTSKSLDYLIIKDNNLWRKKRLARYSLSLKDRERVLRQNLTREQIETPHTPFYYLKKAIFWLGSSPLNSLISKAPGLKRTLRKLAEALHILEPKTGT